MSRRRSKPHAKLRKASQTAPAPATPRASGLLVDCLRPTAETRTWRNRLFRHTMLIIGLVLLPMLWTAASPLSLLQLQRSGERVDAHAEMRFFFVVPYRRLKVEGVTGVSTFASSGSRSVRMGRPSRSHSGTSYLVLRGSEGEAELPASPGSLPHKAQQVRDFLADPAAERLKMVLVSDWLFGVWAGGFLTLLTLLYLGVLAIGIARWTRERWSQGHPSEPAAAH